MEQIIYVPRALGGTLILTIIVPPPTNALLQVREGTAQMQVREGTAELKVREP